MPKQLSPYPEYNQVDENPFQLPSAKLPGADTDLGNVYQQQRKVAKSYRDSIPQQSDEQYNSYSKGARMELAKSIKDTRADFNRRGLLRSGMRQGTELGKQANSVADLASARAKINAGLLDNADQLDTAAFNTAGNLAGQGAGLGDTATSGLKNWATNDLATAMNNQTMLGGLAQGVGSGLGGYFGSRR